MYMITANNAKASMICKVTFVCLLFVYRFDGEFICNIITDFINFTPRLYAYIITSKLRFCFLTMINKPTYFLISKNGCCTFVIHVERSTNKYLQVFQC